MRVSTLWTLKNISEENVSDCGLFKLTAHYEEDGCVPGLTIICAPYTLRVFKGKLHSSWQLLRVHLAAKYLSASSSPKVKETVYLLL